MKNQIYVLDSVGCRIESATLNVYPDAPGAPDELSITPLDECTEEWRESLSDKDRELIEFLEKRFKAEAGTGADHAARARDLADRNEWREVGYHPNTSQISFVDLEGKYRIDLYTSKMTLSLKKKSPRGKWSGAQHFKWISWEKVELVMQYPEEAKEMVNSKQ